MAAQEKLVQEARQREDATAQLAQLDHQIALGQAEEREKALEVRVRRRVICHIAVRRDASVWRVVLSYSCTAWPRGAGGVCGARAACSRPCTVRARTQRDYTRIIAWQYLLRSGVQSPARTAFRSFVAVIYRRDQQF